MAMQIVKLKEEIASLREEWRMIRKERLKQKKLLLEKGMEKTQLKKDIPYRELLKKQKKLSVVMKHMNMKLSRLTAFESKNSNKID